MGENTKQRISNLCTVLVVIFSAIYLIVPALGGFNWLLWMVAILNLVAGPAVFIAYIREVRKGVFADIDETANIEDDQ